MIPDERLSVLISGIDLENISPRGIIDMANELLSLREQNKKLGGYLIDLCWRGVVFLLELQI